MQSYLLASDQYVLDDQVQAACGLFVHQIPWIEILDLARNLQQCDNVTMVQEVHCLQHQLPMQQKRRCRRVGYDICCQ